MASPQTKSFITLIIIAAVFSGAVFYFSKYGTRPQPVLTQADTPSLSDSKDNNITKNSDLAPTDVKNWQEYSDQNSSLSFKYPSSWEVKTHKSTNPDLDIIVIDPGNEQDHLRIYITADNYFAADGLTKQKTQVAGQEAWTVEDLLFGVKTGSEYYTFDLGSSLKLKPTLKAIISTVAFK